jgi:hypothetical protein
MFKFVTIRLNNVYYPNHVKVVVPSNTPKSKIKKIAVKHRKVNDWLTDGKNQTRSDGRNPDGTIRMIPVENSLLKATNALLTDLRENGIDAVLYDDFIKSFESISI